MILLSLSDVAGAASHSTEVDKWKNSQKKIKWKSGYIFLYIVLASGRKSPMEKM